MKKTRLKIIAILTGIMLLCSGISSVVSAVEFEPIKGSVAILPMNIAITATYNNVELGSLGRLSITGKTTVQSGYKSHVTVELQQYSGGWNTIKTWNDDGNLQAIVETNYYVVSGYSYRLKLTHKAYSSSGTLIETITKYSDTINYN